MVELIVTFLYCLYDVKAFFFLKTLFQSIRALHEYMFHIAEKKILNLWGLKTSKKGNFCNQIANVVHFLHLEGLSIMVKESNFTIKL